MLKTIAEGRGVEYFIGIDGGGTKTALCAVNTLDFSPSYTATSGTAWRECGFEGVAAKIKEAAYRLSSDRKIAGMVMGLPCYGESIEGDYALEQAIHKAFPGVSAYITNDVEVGWAGSLGLEPGINIVAGTGSIGFGRDGKGKSVRVGGWSEFFGDEGSCYWIGRKILEFFSKQADGRLPKDPLYDTVSRYFKLDNDYAVCDVIHGEYIQSREKVAQLQLLAKEAAHLGSPTAISLYKDAVSELSDIVYAIRNQLEFRCEPVLVSYTGGLFKSEDFVLPIFKQKIEEMGAELIPPRFTADEGAMLLAFERFCPENLNRAKKALERKMEHNSERG